MAFFLKNSDGVFRNATKIFLKDSDGTWRGVVKAFLKDSLGSWREIFNASYLSPQIEFDAMLVSNETFGRFSQGSTLSLDRGIWTNSPTSYSLTIQASLDETNWTDFAVGSGTSVTYLITIDDVLAPSYYFRGKVVATNSFGSSTFYTLSYPGIVLLNVSATVSSPTSSGGTFNWTVTPSTTSYRSAQYIDFYDSLTPSTLHYTYTATSSANSAVVSNAALLPGKTYYCYVRVISNDTSETVAISDTLTLNTTDNRPVGTDNTVTFSRDSQTSYNYSITSVGTWTNTPTSYRYQWYTYQSTFGGNFAYFIIDGATSSTFNAVDVKALDIMPIVWASNATGESNTGYGIVNTNGTNPSGTLGSISAAATKFVHYKAPVISTFSVTGGSGSATYTYSVTGDDPSFILSISYSGPASGTFTPGVSGSTITGLAAGTYNFVLTATNSVNGNGYSVTSTVANVIVGAPLAAPVNTVAPAVTPTTGTAGSTTYTTTNGTWTGNPTPTYTYQWQYNDQGALWVGISGATSQTYSPPINYTSVYNTTLRCRVTATNSQGAVSANSNQVTVSIATVTTSFDGNGGTSPTALTVNYGSSITLPTSTRANHTLNGWYTASSGGSFVGSAGSSYTPTSSTTLYAQWTQNPQYTVNYNANGGTVSPTSATVFSGNSVTFPTPSRSGYNFMGWYTASAGGTFLGIGGSSYTPTATVTIYAQWAIVQYTVTYNGNGGSTPSSATVNAGSATTLPTSTRANFTFGGWYTAASGGSFVGGAGASYTPPSSITLYAQWVAIPIPNISSITVTGNVTAGVTISAVMTNTFSVQYTIFARDTTTSAWVQTNAGTASANGTSLTTAVATTSSVGTLPDQYYVSMQPFGGPRSTGGAGGGTGTAGTTRSTIGSPKSNASGSITVNY